MRTGWIALTLLGSSLATGVAATETTPATTTPSSPTASTAGAFDRLSPGNQLIARALFQAQKTRAPSGSTTKQPVATAQSTPLTVDQIAAMKQSGQGWGAIFKQMKSQGLIEEKNLGRVVSRFVRAERAPSSSSQATSAAGSGKAQEIGAGGKPEATGSRANDGQEGGVAATGAGGSGHGHALGPGTAAAGSGPRPSGQGGGRGK